MADRIFATITTRRGEELRIALSQFKGRTFPAVRIGYADDNGEMRPSGKGINIKVELLPDIADGITKAFEAAHAEGLLPAEGEQ